MTLVESAVSHTDCHRGGITNHKQAASRTSDLLSLVRSDAIDSTD